MARTLPSTISAGISAAVTAPGYLIEIATTQTLRFSTRGTLTYGGAVYAGGARVEGLTLGGQRAGCTLVLPNADGAVSQLILSGRVNDANVSIYGIYGDAPSERVTLFTGAVEAATDIGLLSCTLAVAEVRNAIWSLPHVMIGPPLANHLRRPGDQIVWGGVVYTLESGDPA
jgi:hypothetical protein